MMRRNVGFTLALTVATAILAIRFGTGAAVTAPAPAKSGSEAKSEERKLKITAPEGTAEYNDSTGTLVVTHATVELPDSDAILRADRIEYNDEENWVRATGKPRLWDPYNEITADVMRADMNAKSTDAKGNVRLVARAKEAKTEAGRKAREHAKEPVTVRSDQMLYFYKDKRGTATGNLKITQKDKRGDRTVTGERLSYDGNEETVTLEGNVHVMNTRGEAFDVGSVTIIFKEGAEGFLMGGGIKNGVLFVREKDEKAPKPGGGTPGSTPPVPAPAPANGEKEKPGAAP